MGNWIRCFHPAPNARSRLLCFPHAGGSASAYHALSTVITGDTEPLIVQYPGRQERFGEPHAQRAEEVVEAVLTALPSLDDGKLTILFGHSMGALLAFETARLLSASGRAPARLIVSGRGAPSLPRSAARGEPVDKMSDTELVEDMRQLSGTEDGLLCSPEPLALLLPAVRSDYRMVDDYVYRSAPMLDCPVTALTGNKDPIVSVESVQAWRSETQASFDCHVLAGGHFFINDHLPYLASLISAVARADCSDGRDRASREHRGALRVTEIL